MGTDVTTKRGEHVSCRHQLLAAAAVVLSVALAGIGPAAASCDGLDGGNSANGKKIYHGTCVACHGEDGKGNVPGAPDFNKRDGVLTEGNTTLINHVRNGFKTASSPMAMPKKGGDPSLTDQDIKDVVIYLNETFHCK